LDNIVSNDKTRPGAFVEIGPHSVLKSPMMETWAQHVVGEAMTYLPSLKRHENSVRSVLHLCGNLFCANLSVDLAAVNALETFDNDTIVQHSRRSVCTSLPLYQYNYGPPIYHESRISREIKQRKHMHHDILGVMQPVCAREMPIWRNILRIKDVPWLQDHELIPEVEFPGAGYVALAIEAIAQHLNRSPADSVCKLRNVSISAAMQIPRDGMGLEVLTSLHVSAHSSDWFKFTVSSIVDSTWTEHASGFVSMASTADRVLPDLKRRMDPRAIEASDWYDKFAQVGLGYGATFRGLSEIQSDPRKNVAAAQVSLITTKDTFTGPESRYSIHPTTLDACFQLGIIAAHGGHTAKVKIAYVPVMIDEMTVWPRTIQDVSGHAVAETHLKGLRGAHARIQLFTASRQPVFEITNMRSVQYVGGDILRESAATLPSPYTRLVWKPDVTTLSRHQANQLFPATVSVAQISATFDQMDLASACMITDLATRQLRSLHGHPHLGRFITWIQRTMNGNHPLIQRVQSMSTGQRAEVMNGVTTTLEDIVDVKHTVRIYDAVPQILEGTKGGVEVALQDGLLDEVYSSGLGISAAYPQIERLLDLLAHKNPSMRILEVGAGTGSATGVAMAVLGGAGLDTKRYSEYVFTDVSSRFLHPAKERFAAFKEVSYRTFDFNQSPESQRFEGAFDLLIASECFHTARDISQALKHVRALLKPEGQLMMLETTRTMLGHGIAYGTFPDYWPTDEERDSPFLSSEEWQHHLRCSGFSGVDIELDDHPAPYTLASTILTKAVVQIADTVPVTDPEVYIICASTQDVFARALASGFAKVYTQTVVVSLDDADIPDGSRVILTTNVSSHPLIEGTESQYEKLKNVVMKSSSILFVTTGDIISGCNLKAAIVTGLVRILISEDSLSCYGVFHLEEDWIPSDGAILHLVIEREARLQAGDLEREIAIHNGVANIGRLLVDEDLNTRYRSMYPSKPTITPRSLDTNVPMNVNFEMPGILSTIYFEHDPTIDERLPDSWIEVETMAIGLNWKDVASSAGKLDINYMSMEFAGIITACGSLVKYFRPGDRVYGLALRKFGTRLRMTAAHAQLMCHEDKFEEVATLPTVFGTAIFAILRLAHLQKDEKVLIQSAAGGLGLAAIQVAQSVGANIYVTAGTKAKRDYLVEHCGIDGSHVFSSRSVPSISAMMQATGSTGFDVILSSSNGTMMQETARCIAKRGRFIDVGRVDVQNHRPFATDFFERNATFSSFDFSKIIEEEPAFAGQ
jgi:NADPH:quinone reductase-like Zn-dependent oxidoreductase/SAM-dependent methyltransferase